MGVTSTSRNGHRPAYRLPKPGRKVTIIYTEADDPGDLVGLREAAKIMGGVDPPRISRWRRQGVMPPVLAVLACGPIWLRRDVEHLAEMRAQLAAERVVARRVRQEEAAARAEARAVARAAKAAR